MIVTDKTPFSFKFKAVDTRDQILLTTFLIYDFQTFSRQWIFLSMTVLKQAANRYVFCVVHE